MKISVQVCFIACLVGMSYNAFAGTQTYNGTNCHLQDASSQRYFSRSGAIRHFTNRNQLTVCPIPWHNQGSLLTLALELETTLPPTTPSMSCYIRVYNRSNQPTYFQRFTVGTGNQITKVSIAPKLLSPGFYSQSLVCYLPSTARIDRYVVTNN